MFPSKYFQRLLHHSNYSRLPERASSCGNCSLQHHSNSGMDAAVCFTDPASLWAQGDNGGSEGEELAKTHFHATIPSSLANKLHEV
jgi:hypothetical protein